MSPTDHPLSWLALRLPKQGHTDAECEDAWAVDRRGRRFAVADGASESAFAGLWARLLVEEFLAAVRPAELTNWLGAPRSRWAAEVTGQELPWYLEEKRKEGAFAALLGLTVRPATAERPCRWRATAVGDCCLVWLRKDNGIRSFPLQKSSDFGSDPQLICSRGGKFPAAAHCTGSLIPGDQLFLMTDALAQWFLRAHENDRQPWEAVAALLSAERPEEAFATWIEELRTTDGMRDDDVTLVVINAAPVPEERES